MPFKLVVVSPEKNLFEGDVESVVLSGSEGRFGILQNHAPMVSALGAGPVAIKAEGSTDEPFMVEGGFVKVNAGEVLVLSDSAFTADDINVEAEQAKLAELLKTVSSSDESFVQNQHRIETCRQKIRYASK